jgi:YdaS antitoxin of YdaST toxin-antitoxin system
MSGNPNPIRQIAALFGGQTGLARALGKNQSTVSEWVAEGRVPSLRIPDVIKAAERLRPPVALRPDHFFGAAEVPVLQQHEAAD